MKDITLKIVGNQLRGLEHEADRDETVEFITEGRFMKKGNAMYLIYDESELSGMEGCTTSLKITDGKVNMRRYGADAGFETAIEFEEGKRWGGYYDTPYGPVKMEVLTNEIKNKLDGEGSGSLWIDCSISLRGMKDGRSRLHFEILQ